MMVELTTSASGMFHQGFRLSVSHQRKRKKFSINQDVMLENCHSVIDVSVQQQGLITSPRHWFPRNTDCTWSLTGNPDHQIWLEIQSPKSKRKIHTCWHQLEISHRSGNPLMICEWNSSIVHSLLVPNRVNLHFSSPTGSLTGLEFGFHIFYMSVPEETYIEGTICDRIVTDSKGTLELIANRLLLRHEQLVCNYRIEAPRGYRIEIAIKQLTFDPIRQCDDARDCSNASRPFDSLVVWDRDVLQCFCQSSSNVTKMVTTSNRVTIQLDLKHIFDQAYKDGGIYRFQIDYAWTVNECGHPVNSFHEGYIHWRANNNVATKSCSWLIDLPTNNRVLFKINSFLGKDCRFNTLLLRYYGNVSREDHHLCLPNGEYISPFPLRFVYLQLQSDRLQTLFHLKWNVLFDSYPTDDPNKRFPCPNTSWSIHKELVCNQQIDCPQNQLYGYLLDEELCNSQLLTHDFYTWLLGILVFSLSTSITVLFIFTVRIWSKENRLA